MPRGPVVAVVGGDTDGGAELAAGLRDLGATVAPLDLAALAGREDLRVALDATTRRLGPLDGVVVASVGIGPTRHAAVAELDGEAWAARVELPLQRTLTCFQGAIGSLRDGGGTVILVIPTLSLVGAAGFGPWAAVTEGQRALAKAAARAWGQRAVTVNCVAVPGALLRNAPDGSGAETYVDRPGQPAPALGRPTMRADVAGVVHALLSPAWRSVTGATVAVDGGVWMTP